MIINSRQRFGSTISREVVIIAAWCISCHRNSLICFTISLCLF
ncbi:hypothetical protein HU200_021379 [Digitaria exilis]|uniref:Uncharacterized protein n=1 Tax=Digitaria exilis TaxID=1010633 RepID=A0A835F0B4_9POAL|nr:hypothetical protein HU200_021379 [Digitaria exilis]